MIKNIPNDLKILLSFFVEKLHKLLGDNLCGIYVYGSLSYGSFEEKRSDVDVIIVIKRKLNNLEFSRIKKLYKSPTIKKSRWFAKLEMDYVVFSALEKNFDFVFKHDFKATHFAHGRLKRMGSSDGRNPINWMNIRDCGIPLLGPAPRTFVPEIRKKIILKAIKRGFTEMKVKMSKWIKKDLWHQTYVVVMLCRISCALKEGKMISKKSAAQWGLKNLPTKFAPMIRIALLKMDNTNGPLDETIPKMLPHFVKYVNNLF